MRIHVHLFWRMNFDSTENGRKKSFSCKTKHQCRVSQCGEHDCSAIMSKMEITMSIKVCLISPVNIYYRENGGMKCFSCKSK